MPELPPPPSDAFDAAASLRTWLADADGRLSARRLLAAGGAVLAVVVVGVVAWQAFAGGALRGTGPPPELTMPRAGAGASGGPSSSAGHPSTSGVPSSSVVVAHVAGAVARPGLYRLGGAPRIADAIDAAGGPSPDADLDAVNLAAPVADGERVYLPRRGESPPPAMATAVAAAVPLDLNTATAEQLDALPGVGPSTAAAILAYRAEHGRFRSVDELLEVRGIGDARLAELRPKVRVR